MVPETFGALLAFFGLVAPGLAFELLREKRRPSLEETAFREASRIALTSLLFTVGSLAVLAIIRRVNNSLVADVAEWIERGNDYVRENLALVSMTLLLELLVALGLVVAVDWFFRRSAPGHIVPGSIWFQLFRRRRPAGTTPWVHIKLVDETEIWGFVGDYSADQDLDNRELTIVGPKLEYRRKGNPDESLDSWSSISVRGDSINWLKVAYVSDDSPPNRPRLVEAVDNKRK